MDELIIVHLKKVEDLEALNKLQLPVKIFTIEKTEGNRNIQIYFDSDDETSVRATMKIVKPFFKEYNEVKQETKDKNEVLKELGLTRE